jgi:hypothetical protein
MEVAVAEIISKFWARCKACAKWVAYNSPALRLEKGIRHVDDAACAQAHEDWRPVKPALGSLEHWRMLVSIGRDAEARPWTFASTMAQWPHSWTKRRGADQPFVDLVSATRTIGRDAKWRTANRSYLDINDHQYWACSPDSSHPDHEILVNRSVLTFDSWQPARLSVVQMAYLEDMVGGLQGKSVLDFGGTMYTGATPRYLAIGPKADMQTVHGPRAIATVATYVPMTDAFATADVVYAVGGVADRFTTLELQRLPTFLNPGGILVAQFTRTTPSAWVLDVWPKSTVIQGTSSVLVVAHG